MSKVKSCLILFLIAIVSCGLFLVCPLFEKNVAVLGEQINPVAEENKYSITYIVDGSTYKVNDYSIGELVEKQAVPEKDGYFGEWDILEPDFMADQDIVINAVYIAKIYTITFKTHDGNVLDVAEYSVESSVILEPIVPERSGYTGNWSSYDLSIFEDQTVIAEYVKNICITDEFQNAKELGLKTHEVSNLVSDRGGHKDWGAIPANKWGDPVSGGNGYLTYVLKADEGEMFRNLNFSFTCKYGNTRGYYWNGEEGSPIGANAFVKISYDNERWVTVYNLNEDTSLTEDGTKPMSQQVLTTLNLPTYSPSVDLSTYLSGHNVVYIKLEVSHYTIEEYNQANGRSDSGINLSRLAFLLYRTEITGETEKGMMMNEGASVKITNSGVGLRYTTNIPREFYESLIIQGYTITAKTLIMPASYFTRYGDINYNTVFGENAVYSPNGKDVSKVKIYESDGTIAYNKDKDCYYFRGVLDKVTENESGIEYLGRGYVVYEKDGQKFYDFAIYNAYNEENNVRSMQMVALSAYNDLDSGLTDSQRQILKSNYKFLQKYDVSGIKFTNTFATYDGNVHSIGVEGLPEGVQVVFTNNQNVLGGKHIVNVKFIVEDGYYPIASKSVVLTIEKRLLEVEFIGETFLEYTGTAQKTLSVNATNLIGNDAVSLSIEYSGDMIELGSYTATCILQENTNYKLLYGNTKTVVITKKENYTNFFNVSNWRNTSNGTLTQIETTETGLKYYGNGYCNLPLDISSGLRLEFDLSALPEKTEEDHWFGFGIGCTPTHGSYASTSTGDPGFIYIMLSKEYGLYHIRMQYFDASGTPYSLGGKYLGTDPRFVFEMEKFSDSWLYTDNIDIFLNGIKMDNGVVDQRVIYSSLRDVNGYSYMCISVHGVDLAKRTGYINYIGPKDSETPEIKLSREFPEIVNVGEYVILPKITVNDKNEFSYTNYLYSPSGKTLVNTFSSEVPYLITEEGTYKLVVKAIDESRNDVFFYREFTVGESPKTREFAVGTSSTELPDYVDEISGDWFDAFVENTYTQDGFNQGVIKCPYYTATVIDAKGNEVEVYTYAVPYFRTTTHSFGYVDTDKDCLPLTVKITANYQLDSAVVIPEAFQIIPTVNDNTVEFTINDFDTFNVFFNGKFNPEKPFTLFVRENYNLHVPSGYKVLEFERGIHFVSPLTITNNTILYLHTGAYVVCLPHLDWENAFNNTHGNYVYTGLIVVSGMKNISVVGHGVFDFSLLYRHERSPFNISLSENIKVDGVTMINATGWTMVFSLCDNVHVKNVIGFGVKTNSDGIATCNSKNVLVEKCFLRSGDDLFEIKANGTSTVKDPNVENVIYRDCQAWAEKTRSFGFIQETVANVNNVKFINCHSLVQNATWKEGTGKESMGAFMVLVGDTHTVSNFEFINCSSYLCAGYVINVSVEKNEWTYDSTADYGALRDIYFKNFSYYKEPEGYDVYMGGGTKSIANDIRLYNDSNDAEKFKNIFFENVYRNGTLVQSLEDLKIIYHNVTLEANNVVYINNR